MKCILLDDEIPGLTYLKMLCQQIAELEIVKAYTDPVKFVSELEQLDFDLCILDVEMPKLNGVQVANLLRDKLIIFTTAYKEYAADAFDLHAVDYVQKPVKKERLQIAINKALERRGQKSPEKQYLQLNTDRGKTIIHFEELAYISTSDVDSRDKLAMMVDGSSLIIKNISFENLQNQLRGTVFCRVNKKQMISLKIVASFTFDEITTTLTQDEKPVKIPLSEAYRSSFQKMIKSIS